MIAAYVDASVLDQLAQIYIDFWNFRIGYNALGSLSDFVRFISLGCIDKFPFLPDDLLPPVNAALVDAIERQDVEAIVSLLPEFVRHVRTSLVTLHAFLGQASGFLRSAIECVGRLPNSNVAKTFAICCGLLIRRCSHGWEPSLRRFPPGDHAARSQVQCLERGRGRSAPCSGADDRSRGV